MSRYSTGQQNADGSGLVEIASIDDTLTTTDTDRDTNIDDEESLRTVSSIYGRVSDTIVKPIGIDGSTHAINTIDYAHHEIHGGSAYDITEVKDQSANHCRDIQITTPAGAKLIHMTIDFATEAQTEAWFWEDVVIATPGTPFTPLNHRRDAGENSILTVGVIDNTTLANANSDTETANGGNPATLLAHGITGSGKKVGGAGASREEWILKPGEDYLIRWEATSAGWVSYHIDWYEHTDRD